MTRPEHFHPPRPYLRGALIPATPDLLLHVVEGVVAQRVIHEDGTEILLGFYGPEQLLIPHPADSCYIHFQAHTDVTLQALPWADAQQLPALAAQLRARIWQQQAWAALQARPANEDRLFGMLALWAEQFGVAVAEGTLLDLRHGRNPIHGYPPDPYPAASPTPLHHWRRQPGTLFITSTSPEQAPRTHCPLKTVALR